MGWFIAILYIKFLVFDLIWAFGTTFSGFQFPISYLTKLCLATLLALPLMGIRRKWYIYVICILVDLWLVANLMYFRTYYTIIPGASYFLVGNLQGFESSVTDSVRWVDLVFPALTVGAVIFYRGVDVRTLMSKPTRKLWLWLLALIIVPLLVVCLHSLWKGSYKDAYEDLMYDYSSSGAAVYTIPGVLIYEQIAKVDELTPKDLERIEEWLAAPRAPGLELAGADCNLLGPNALCDTRLAQKSIVRQQIPRAPAQLHDRCQLHGPRHWRVCGAHTQQSQICGYNDCNHRRP